MRILTTITNFINSLQPNGKKADIVLSSDDGSENVVFPVVPDPLPEVVISQNNKVFNATTGDINIVGNMALKTVNFQDILLTERKNLPFIRPNASTATEIINFIKKNREQQKVMHITIIFVDGETYLDMPCTVDSFSYKYNRNGFYTCNIGFTEYRYINNAINAQKGGRLL